jgi:hypothetical protein
MLGGIGNDALTGDLGEAGDRFSVDRMWGGAGADTLAGGDANDLLGGGDGDDTLLGELGNDRILGGPGNDRSDGGPDNDRLAGGPGDDTQAGGPGNDRILANAGQDHSIGGDGNDDLWALMRADVTPGPNGEVDPNGDTLDGGFGNDVFHTRDGEIDHITCGDGFDRAQLDTVDVIDDATAAHPDGSCEKVRRAEPRGKEGVEEEGAREPKEPKDA